MTNGDSTERVWVTILRAEGHEASAAVKDTLERLPKGGVTLVRLDPSYDYIYEIRASFLLNSPNLARDIKAMGETASRLMTTALSRSDRKKKLSSRWSEGIYAYALVAAERASSKRQQFVGTGGSS